VEVKPGDEVEVALDSVEDGTVETRLSRERPSARAPGRVWKLHSTTLRSSLRHHSRVKGGFTVEIDNVRAFLPGSLVDVRPVRDTSYLENKPLEFKVINSTRSAITSWSHGVRCGAGILRRAQRPDGQPAGRRGVRGSVKNLNRLRAFVDPGGIDGLLHITDMALEARQTPVGSRQGWDESTYASQV